MKKWIAVLMVLVLIGCGGGGSGGSGDDPENIYEVKLNKIIEDLTLYNDSDENSPNDVLKDGIYIRANTTGEELLYVYDYEKLINLNDAEKEEILLLLEEESDMGNVEVVIDDNSKNIDDYESVENVKETGISPKIDLDQPVANEDGETAGNTKNKIITDSIQDIASDSFVVNVQNNVDSPEINADELIGQEIKIYYDEIYTRRADSSFIIGIIVDVLANGGFKIELESGSQFSDGINYYFQSTEFIFFLNVNFTFEDNQEEAVKIESIQESGNGYILIELDKVITEFNFDKSLFEVRQVLNDLETELANIQVTILDEEFVKINIEKIESKEEKQTLQYIVTYNNGQEYKSSIIYIDSNTIPDTEKPVITLTNDSTINLYVGDTYTEYGATAVDNVDGNISGEIVISGEVDTSVAGTYYVTYNVSDEAGNTADEVMRTVIVSTRPSSGFVYNGTSYTGRGTTLNSSSPQVYSDSNISITNPSVKSFEADAFFVMEGNVTYTGADQYIWVRVIKDSTSEETSYWLRGNFEKRIWLRFGAGEYTVKVHKTEQTVNNLNYEGDLLGWSSYGETYLFNVTNTRNEDGKYYYPSGPIQSDDPTLMNIASQLTQGISTDSEKIRAIHDWVVKELYYDDFSLPEGQRKKQDAISTYNNGTAVCEGYTSLINALLRASGFRVKAIAGLGGGGGHAWTNIYYEGSWKFIDVTWADPGGYGDADGPGGRDDDPSGGNLSLTYYMLNSLTGVDDSHTPQDDRPARNITVEMPSWEGYPNGIY